MQRKLRDFVALVLAAILISPLLIGAAGAGGGRNADPPGGAPDVGTIVDIQEEAERHLPAGKESQHAAESESAVEPASSSPPVKTSSSTSSSLKAEEEPAIEADSDIPERAQTLQQQREKKNFKESPRAAEDAAPTPTEVERRPKPVSAMSAQEVQQTVAQYRTWVFKGQIRLTLEHSQLGRNDLPQIASYFLLSQFDGNGNVQQQELIDASGRFRDDLRESISEDMLMGDLGSQDQWPSILVSKAREAFGPQHRSHAKFYLSDAWALRIYRVLAQAVKGRDVSPGTEFVMRIQHDPSGKLQVEISEERSSNP